jgi:hypothetical protein
VNIGCAKCHTPQLQTGPSPISALANKTFLPYSDLLLHDMGTGLNDGYTEALLFLPNGERLPCGASVFRKIRRVVNTICFTTEEPEVLMKQFSSTAAKPNKQN